MRKHKISIGKVQEAFNSAIKRRDGRCMVRDYEPCCGQLECSHFYTVGSTPALRFYPPNAYAQCQKHHWNHHNKKESSEVYKNWLMENEPCQVIIMDAIRNDYIKYTDELKAEIISLCNEDRLEELAELIIKELNK